MFLAIIAMNFLTIIETPKINGWIYLGGILFGSIISYIFYK